MSLVPVTNNNPLLLSATPPNIVEPVSTNVLLINLFPIGFFHSRFPEIKFVQAYELLGLINENLWIGHFDITSKNGIPAFRHTILSNTDTDSLHKKFEDQQEQKSLEFSWLWFCNRFRTQH